MTDEHEPPDEAVAFVLTRRRYAEVVGGLLALRRLAVDLEHVFSTFGHSRDRRAADGAVAMVETIDRVLDVLGFAGERDIVP